MMCTTSSADVALIQEASAAGQEGSLDTTGLWEKERPSHNSRAARTGHWSTQVAEIHIHANITQHHTYTVAAETKESLQGI